MKQADMKAKTIKMPEESDAALSRLLAGASSPRKTAEVRQILRQAINELADYRTLLLWMMNCRADLLERHPTGEIAVSLKLVDHELKGVLSQKGTLHDAKEALEEYEKKIASSISPNLVYHADVVEEDIEKLKEVIEAVKAAREILREYLDKINDLEKGKMHLITGSEAEKRIDRINTIIEILNPWAKKG